MILVYGTDSIPKSAIPKGIPKLPVLPTKATAKYIDWSVLSLNISLAAGIKKSNTPKTINKYIIGEATNS